MELLTDVVITEYRSPLGEIILASSAGILRGLWFKDQRYACAGIASCERVPVMHESFREARQWLDGYFCGNTSAPSFPFEPVGTDFQKAVWAELVKIPYGTISTYKEIAERIKCKSPRAAGSAIGRNPISLIIPCHRVIGTDGRLTGYAGGIERKEKLLAMERRFISE